MNIVCDFRLKIGKGFFRCLFIYFRGSASVALMRGSASVPMIYGVLPVLHLCVVPVAF